MSFANVLEVKLPRGCLNRLEAVKKERQIQEVTDEIRENTLWGLDGLSSKRASQQSAHSRFFAPWNCKSNLDRELWVVSQE